MRFTSIPAGSLLIGAMMGLLAGVMLSVNAATSLHSTQNDSQFDSAYEENATPLRAAQWGLDASEWNRYTNLMGGIRGSVSVPTISPLEVLGIHARDPGERREYAERLTQLMQDDTARVLAFQLEYHQAWKRLYPGVKVFDKPELHKASAKNSSSASIPATTFLPTDRVLLFIQPDCIPCRFALRHMTQVLQAGGIAGLDIYLSGLPNTTDDAVRDWARTENIDTQRVHDRTITLNHDNGLLARLLPDTKPPQVLRQRSGQYTALEFDTRWLR